MLEKPIEQPVNKPYRKLQVDDLPILEPLEKLDYQTLLTGYLDKHGKPLKPIQRRSNSKVTVPQSMNCPKCGAPKNPQAFKISYILGSFTSTFSLSKRSRKLPRVDLSNIHASPHTHTLGLTLTYHLNRTFKGN
jgi:hypothetical protein